MSINEKKMQIVIDNYFKSECDVNTSIRQAFEKGFRIGVKKGLSTESEPRSISYLDCSNAMLKMWMDNVLTDGEYNRIMDKLNAKHVEDVRGDSE
jgi:hypothetical protein